MPTRRHRSAVACQACRNRKVRCSLSVTGVPCVGCTQDRTECVVNPPRKTKSRRDHMPSPRRNLQSSSHTYNTQSDAIHNQSVSNPPSDQQINVPIFQVPSSSQNVHPATSLMDHSQRHIEEEERNGSEIAAAVLGKQQSIGGVPFYTGERSSGASTLDICSPNLSLPRHVLIPSHSLPLLSDEDRIYLRGKGLFTLPKSDTCDSLIRAYLYNVHPILPIIEVDVLLNYYQSGRLLEYNILLLWSVFFAAVNYIPKNVYEQEGYGTRKEMKASMYYRAKCVYGMGAERDKIVLLQASLLMGFWHSEEDEHMQPWYWTGNAINICQMLGLHRNPDSSRYNSSISNRQRFLWRRLWWSCFFRDRWLSLTLGRPLRINLSDCDTPRPLVTDILNDIDRISESSLAEYVPSDLPRLAEFWIILIELSELLGQVLIMNYQVHRPKPSIFQIESLESQVLQCKLPDRYEAGLNRLVKFYSHHVHLHFQALLTTFYGPLATEIPEGLYPNQQEDWQRRMGLKADASASQTNEIIEALAQEKLLEFAGPMTPPLLVPAMQRHLLCCKSADPLSKRLRLNKLDMCMLILEELQKTYTVASIYRAIFSKAIQQTCPGYQTSTAESIQTDTMDDAAAGLAVSHLTDDSVPAINRMGQDEAVCPALSEDFINALMDEASIFDFWETWNKG